MKHAMLRGSLIVGVTVDYEFSLDMYACIVQIESKIGLSVQLDHAITEHSRRPRDCSMGMLRKNGRRIWLPSPPARKQPSNKDWESEVSAVIKSDCNFSDVLQIDAEIVPVERGAQETN